MTTPTDTALDPLVAALRSLPPGTAGALSEGARLLVLTKKRDRLELRLQLSTGLGADPLLDALVCVPGDALLRTTVKSLARLGDFTRRELEYLEAMLAWSARVLSAPAPALKKRSAVSPARKAVRKLLEAATDGSAKEARRFLEEHSDTLATLADHEVAHIALDFLREDDVLVEVDWKDEEDFAWAATRRMEQLGLNAVAQELREARPGSTLPEQTATVAGLLQTVDYALTEIDDGSDSYSFVICSLARAHLVIESLRALGVTAKPVGGAGVAPT